MKRILVCTNYAKDQDLSFTLLVLSFLRERGAEAKAFFPLTPAESLPADLPEDGAAFDAGGAERDAEGRAVFGGE